MTTEQRKRITEMALKSLREMKDFTKELDDPAETHNLIELAKAYSQGVILIASVSETFDLMENLYKENHDGESTTEV